MQVIVTAALFVLFAFHTTQGQSTEANQANGTGPGHQMLASVGFELDLLTSARNRTNEAFIEDEFNLFEGLAKAVIDLESASITRQPQPFQLLTALQSPVEYRGTYVQLKGTVRRISPLKITSARLRQAINRDIYYHVDFFVSTHKTNFHLKDQQGDVVIGGTYGVTLILFDLPDEIRNAKGHTDLLVPGLYLKNWSHKTAETRGVSDELRRPNPIVFGISSLVRKPLAVDGGSAGVLIAWCLAVLLVVLSVFAGWQLRASMARRRVTADDPPAIDLSHLD